MAEERRYWDEEVETMPLDKLKKLQEERLQALVARAYEKTGLYRRKFDKVGIKPDDIKTLDDLEKLPLTTYLEDFCRTPLVEKLAIPIEETKTIQSTSGTVSGFTQPILMSKRDWEFYSYGEARSRWTIGVRPGDIVQLLHSLESCPRGYEAIGTTVLFSSAGRWNLDHQIRLAKQMNVTVIEHLPSLALRYLERAKELGINIKETKLRLVSGVGESWAKAFKERMETQYAISFRTLYGTAETGGIGVECEQGGGMHLFADCGIVEVIDPETERVLGTGEEGEIVVTPLWVEAMPLIRYKTGDIGSLLPYEPCPCGRTHPKMSVVKGRVTHIIKIKEKKILPIDVEEVVASTPGLGDEYQIIVDKPGEQQRLKVKVESRPEVENLGALKNQVEETLYRDLGVESEVELVPMGTLGRPLFKAQRIITTYGG
jgi:phenylacetate-CoA ligase